MEGLVMKLFDLDFGKYLSDGGCAPLVKLALQKAAPVLVLCHRQHLQAWR